MALPGHSQKVTIRGRRGQHVYFARDVACHIFPLQSSGLYQVDPEMASKYRYAIHYDPTTQLVDNDGNPKGLIAVDDVIIWEVFGEQEMPIAMITHAEGIFFTVLTAYFMPVAQGAGA